MGNVYHAARLEETIHKWIQGGKKRWQDYSKSRWAAARTAFETIL
jgi:hypothetical protein